MSVATEPPHVEFDTSGNVVRARIASRSVAGRWYTLERSASGVWMHTDTACRGWCDRGACYHVRAMEEVMTDNEETRLITVQANPLALLDAVELEDIMGSKLIPSDKHIYAFQVKGQRVEGVSIDGVRDAARALSTKGEAIRELWVRLEREDERDAYFIACAARYAVAPDGREICMDTAIRAKRQPKYLKLRDGGEQFNEAWYEIGVAKAVRNATEALLPEALKDWMKQKAKERRAGVPDNGNARPQRPPQQRQEPIDAAPDDDAPEPPPPAQIPLGARINKVLRDIADTWDQDAKAKVRARLDRQFPGAISPSGQLMIGKLDADAQAKLWAWLQKLTGAPEPAPAQEQDEEQLPFE